MSPNGVPKWSRLKRITSEPTVCQEARPEDEEGMGFRRSRIHIPASRSDSLHPTEPLIRGRCYLTSKSRSMVAVAPFLSDTTNW